MPWGVTVPAVAAAGSAYSANKQSNAADAAAKSANAQSTLSQAQMAPWTNSGVGAKNQLDVLMGITPKLDDYNTLKARISAQYKSPEKFRDEIRLQVQQQMAAQKRAVANAKASPNFGMMKKSFTQNDFVKDPGYDFRLQQGNLALDRSASSRGNLFSGAAAKELSRYNQDFASNEYGNAYNRWNADRQNQFNRLQSISNAGMGNAGSQAQLAQAYNNAGNEYRMQGANAMAAGAQGIVGALGQGMNYWQNKQMIDKMKQV